MNKYSASSVGRIEGSGDELLRADSLVVSLMRSESDIEFGRSLKLEPHADAPRITLR